jgi:hypothetical protein
MNKTQVVNVYNEPYDVCIMRPGRWQNQYRIGIDGTREEVILKHRKEMLYNIRYNDEYLRSLLFLRGEKLGCCKPKACHGDNYVDILNAKVIGIVGSRRRFNQNDFNKVKDKFFSIYKQGDIIVSGGCPTGGDKFAEDIADDYNIPIMIFRAKWKQYGRIAGFIRNTDVAKESWELIACVANDRTGGTEDTIEKFCKNKTEKEIESLLHLV